MKLEFMGRMRPRFPMALLAAGIIGLALVMMVVAAPAARAAGDKTQIDGGDGDTCAVWTDGKLKCWGNDFPPR